MVKVDDFAVTLEQLQTQIAEMSRHIELLEQRNAAAVATPKADNRAIPEERVSSGITETELIAISAALAAYLGVRVHIRHVRLVSTAAWAQEGRVSIQASHRLQG